MIIKYKRSYKKLNKNKQPIVVFVYEVTGSKEQLDQYKELSGEHYRETEENKPVFFSTRFVGDSGRLLVTKNNKIVVDTSEFDKALSIVSQYGGNLGNAMATAMAGKLLGNTQLISTPADVVDEPIDQLD